MTNRAHRSRAEQLCARFLPRLAPTALAEAHTRVSALLVEFPQESDSVLSGRAAARLADLLEPASVSLTDASLDLPPATTLAERARGVHARLAREAPPEIADGVPLAWAGTDASRDDIAALWRSRARTGPREGEQLFAYVHVPFCRTRCSFCQFESVVDEDATSRLAFVEALEEEAATLSAAAGPLEASALTVGGGTPSELTAEQLARVLRALLGVVTPRAGAYFSVEMNPDSASEDRVAVLDAAGVTRVSMGVQSASAATLRAVARGYQTWAMVEDAVQAIRRRPSLTLGLDLLAPLPHETLESFRGGALRALELGPDELVLYRYQPVLRGRERTIAPGPLGFEHAADAFVSLARSRGYELAAHTGSSCVARRPRVREWSPRYVQHPREPTSMLGLGPHAESHVFGHGRYVRTAEDRYRLVRTNLAAERAMLVGRRLSADLPIDEDALRRSTGASLAESRGEAVGYLLERRELETSAGGESLTPRWAARADALASGWAFLDDATIQTVASAGSANGEAASPGDAPSSRERARRSRWLVTAQAARRTEVAELAVEDLLLDERDDRLRALLDPQIGPREASAVARLIFDGVLFPLLDVVRDGGAVEIGARVAAPSAEALGWLRDRSGLAPRADLGPPTAITRFGWVREGEHQHASAHRSLDRSAPVSRALLGRLGVEGSRAIALLHEERAAQLGDRVVVGIDSATDETALLRETLASALVRHAGLASSMLQELASRERAHLSALVIPLERDGSRQKPRLDRMAAVLERSERPRRRLPIDGEARTK